MVYGGHFPYLVGVADGAAQDAEGNGVRSDEERDSQHGTLFTPLEGDKRRTGEHSGETHQNRLPGISKKEVNMF